MAIQYDTQTVDFYPGREHQEPRMLALNPLGQLPILEDNGKVLRDAQAILTYLAVKYDQNDKWYPV